MRHWSDSTFANEALACASGSVVRRRPCERSTAGEAPGATTGMTRPSPLPENPQQHTCAGRCECQQQLDGIEPDGAEGDVSALLQSRRAVISPVGPRNDQPAGHPSGVEPAGNKNEQRAEERQQYKSPTGCPRCNSEDSKQDCRPENPDQELAAADRPRQRLRLSCRIERRAALRAAVFGQPREVVAAVATEERHPTVFTRCCHECSGSANRGACHAQAQHGHALLRPADKASPWNALRIQAEHCVASAREKPGARPRPVLGMLYKPATHGIHVNVFDLGRDGLRVTYAPPRIAVGVPHSGQRPDVFPVRS
jgi:hypothetical protein